LLQLLFQVVPYFYINHDQGALASTAILQDGTGVKLQFTEMERAKQMGKISRRLKKTNNKLDGNVSLLP